MTTLWRRGPLEKFVVWLEFCGRTSFLHRNSRHMVEVYGDGFSDNAACQSGRTGVHDDNPIGRPPHRGRLWTGTSGFTNFGKPTNRNSRFIRSFGIAIGTAHDRSLKNWIIAKYLYLFAGYQGFWRKGRKKPTFWGSSFLPPTVNWWRKRVLFPRVTDHGAWVVPVTPQRKINRNAVGTSNFTESQNKKIQILSFCRKVMSSVSLDADGFGHFEAVPRTTTNNADTYCSTLRLLATAWGKRVDVCREMLGLPFSTTLYPHCACRTQTFCSLFTGNCWTIDCVVLTLCYRTVICVGRWMRNSHAKLGQMRHGVLRLCWNLIFQWNKWTTVNV